MRGILFLSRDANHPCSVKIQVEDVSTDIKNQNQKNQESLRNFYKNVTRLIEVYNSVESTKFKVWFKGNNRLEIHEIGNEEPSALPADLKAKRSGKDGSGKGREGKVEGDSESDTARECMANDQ